MAYIVIAFTLMAYRAMVNLVALFYLPNMRTHMSTHISSYVSTHARNKIAVHVSGVMPVQTTVPMSELICWHIQHRRVHRTSPFYLFYGTIFWSHT